MASTTTTTILSTHPKTSIFFHQRPPQDWCLYNYLRTSYTTSPRQVFNQWPRSLSKIDACTSPCCNDHHRARATKLLLHFNEEVYLPLPLLTEVSWEFDYLLRRRYGT